MATYNPNTPHKNKGFALIGLVVVIAILMMLYFVDMRAVFRTEVNNTKTSTIKPWFEEERIVPDDQSIKSPGSPKIELYGKETFQTPVYRGQDQRGNITVTIDANGKVTCHWNAQYQQTDRFYVYQATAAGNIDVEKTFTQDGKKDKSRLFFITKGSYKKATCKGQDHAEVIDVEEGEMYVTGWIDTDFTIQGLITITTDRSWSAQYTWQRSKD